MSVAQKSATLYRSGLMAAGDKGKLNKLEILSDGSIESQVPIKLASDPSQLNEAATVSYTNRTAGIDAIAGVKPTLDLNFADMADPLAPNGVNWPANLPFSRASSATRINAAGLMETVPTGTPRIDHDPVTGEVKGLLIEQQATNLLKNSTAITDWVELGSTITDVGGHFVAKQDSNTGFHRIKYAAITGITSSPHTFSVYLRRSSSRYAALSMSDSVTGDASAVFDLANGQIERVNGTPFVDGTWTNITARIEPAGYDFYRCEISGINNSSSSIAPFVYIMSDDGINTSYAGNGAGTIHLKNPQLEAGSYATSFIPTAGSQVTRVADILDIDVGSIVRPDAFTCFTSFTRAHDTTEQSPMILSLNNGTNINENHSLFLASGPAARLDSRDANVNVTAMNAAINLPDKNNVVFRVSENNYAITANGAIPVKDTLASVPQDLTNLSAGQRFGYFPFDGAISRISLFPQALPDQKLQELTK